MRILWIQSYNNVLVIIITFRLNITIKYCLTSSWKYNQAFPYQCDSFGECLVLYPCVNMRCCLRDLLSVILNLLQIKRPKLGCSRLLPAVFLRFLELRTRMEFTELQTFLIMYFKSVIILSSAIPILSSFTILQIIGVKMVELVKTRLK